VLFVDEITRNGMRSAKWICGSVLLPQAGAVIQKSLMMLDFDHLAINHERFERKDNSRGFSKTLCSGREFSPSRGFPDGIGPTPRSKRFRTSRYGHSLHWSINALPRLRALVRRNSTYDRYRGADFDVVLDQRIGRCCPRTFGHSLSTCY